MNQIKEEQAIEDAVRVPRKTLGALADLLDRSGIDIEDIAKVVRINAWQGFYKDENDEAHTVDMVGIQLTPHWAEGPQWPIVQPPAPVRISPRPAPKVARAGEVIVILPDPQIGYRRYTDGTLDPFHDERAIDIALQVIRLAKPDRIVNLGDTCDFPEWSSKFLVKPEMVLTTQPTVDRAHRFFAEQLTEAPDGCLVDVLEGNHDDRLPIAITKNAMAALRLRKGGDPPDSWPLLSMPSILGLDRFEGRVRYHSGYPAGRIRLAAGGPGQAPLWAIHGQKLKVADVAKTERQSFVQGHMHHIQDHYETYEIDGEPVTVNAWSPGALCRIDGAVPSTNSAEDDNGVPLRRWERWQQGLAVVTVQPDGAWSKEIIEIHHGRAIWRGAEFRAA